MPGCRTVWNAACARPAAVLADRACGAAPATLRPLAAANRLDNRRRGWIAAIEADLGR
jgi:hypothetical protein